MRVKYNRNGEPQRTERMCSLDVMRSRELSWRVVVAPDPYRAALADINRRTSAKDYMAAYNARLRAGGTIDAATCAELRDEQGDGCFWCGCDLHGAGHLDHVIPVSAGGASERSNLVWACIPCNRRKGTMLPDEWSRERFYSWP